MVKPAPRFLPTPRMGALAFRSFFRHPLTVAAAVALAIVPLLYTGVYLWAFWDPFGRVDNLPVALVNEDEPTTVDGDEIDAGATLTDRLVERGDLDWHVVDAREAAAGVASGRYYASITVPADFSADLASPSDTGADPVAAHLRVEFNDATNYIATELLTMGFREIEQAVNATAVGRYLDTLFIAFNEIHSRSAEAAGGAEELADGATEAKDGSGELDSGLGDAEEGADELAGGLDTAAGGAGDLADGAAAAEDGSGTLLEGLESAHDGAGDLADGAASADEGAQTLLGGLESADEGAGDLESGLDTLYSGSVGLASGAGSASARVDAKTDEINALADTWIPRLEEDGPAVAEGAGAVADAADLLADALEELPELTEEETALLGGVHERIDAYLGEHPALEQEEPLLYDLLRDARWASGLAVALNDHVEEHRDRIDSIAAEARTVRDLADALAADAPDLADDSEDARDQVNELNDGLKDLASGSAALRDGLEDARDGADSLGTGLGELVTGADGLGSGLGALSSGAGDLDSGLGELVTGAEGLDAGLGTLASGADSLDSGLVTLDEGAGSLDEGIAALHVGAGDLDSGLADLESGSGELATGLEDGAEEIPTFDAGSRSAREDMMSAPAQLSTVHDNEVPNYGTGFAPFFLGLSLWVGAMVVYMVLPALSPRGPASTAPSWRLAIASWLPGLALGIVQAVAMVTALHVLLGLDSVNWPGLIGFLALAAASYTAIVHWIDAQFGAPGKVIVLILLILQITSAGGTYPLQTSPEFFQAIAPFTPMYWVVGATRHLISGGETAIVLHACLVLTAFMVAALLLTWAAVAGKRTWTMARLHPVLRI